MKEEDSLKQEKIRGKKGVVFDVDNTLVDTNHVFESAYDELRIFLKEKFGDETGEEIQNGLLFDTYDEEGDYWGILDIIFIARKFSKSLVEKNLIKENERYEIEKCLSEIYNTIPEFLPGARELLEHLYNKRYKIAFCTHSGEWGNLKTKGIWNDLGFPEDELVYLTIPLEEKKEGKDWFKVVDMLGLGVNDVVVIGDNKEADILAAQSIGIDTCVFYKYATPQKVPLDVEIKKEGCVVYEKDSLYDIINLF